MTIGAVGIGAGWSATTEVEEPGAGGVDGGMALDEADGVADRAMEVVLAGESEFADAATHDAQTAARQAAERRIEQRTKIREIQKRIAEAQANKSFWDKIGEAFTYIGAAIATIGSVVASALSFGSAAPLGLAGSVAMWSAIAGAGAGVVAAGSHFGAASLGTDAANLQADEMAVDDAMAMTHDQLGQAQAFAQAIVDTEDALRQQALSWIRNEDGGRQASVSVPR
ncbi:MAG: hypothetical protein HY905_04515 [Deltaproteobacteria bacterium]|nr:hypothetical protein [Deltaproteobacteria bacterium]